MPNFLVILVSLAAAAAGLFAGRLAERTPAAYWRYLMAGGLVFMPLMVGGFTWYEEIYLLCFLIASPPGRMSIPRSVYHFVFVAMLGYFLLQSFRGIFTAWDLEGLSDGLRKVRWPLFFLVLAGVYMKSRDPRIKDAADPSLAYWGVLAGLFVNAAHFLWGIFSLAAYGSPAYTQGAMAIGPAPSAVQSLVGIWGATAYVHSLSPVFIIGILKVIRDGALRQRYVATFSLLVMLASMLLYDSRSAGGAIAILILMAVPVFRLRNVLRVASLSCAVLLLLLLGSEKFRHKVEWFWEDMRNTVSSDSPTANALQDIDRKIWLRAAIPPLIADPIHFVLGYGMRMSGYVVAPHVYSMFREHGIYKDFDYDVGTEAITNFAVDTGVLGLLLLLICICCAAVEAGRVVSAWRFVFISALALTAGWLFIINIFDSMMLYLSLMPGGIYYRLAASSAEQAGLHVRA